MTKTTIGKLLVTGLIALSAIGGATSTAFAKDGADDAGTVVDDRGVDANDTADDNGIDANDAPDDNGVDAQPHA